MVDEIKTVDESEALPVEEIPEPTVADLIEAAYETVNLAQFQSRDSALTDGEVLDAFEILPAGICGAEFAEWLAAIVETAADNTPAVSGEEASALSQSEEGDSAEGDSSETASEPDIWEGARATLERERLEDLRVLHSSSGVCFYSTQFMTDSYARWLLLAREGDDATTFLTCVREESRIYPRPMQAKSLGNAPFLLSQERVAEVFAAVQASGEHDDIHRTEASNGDVYYYSTDYISDVAARRLAEWYSVDYWDNP